MPLAEEQLIPLVEDAEQEENLGSPQLPEFTPLYDLSEKEKSDSLTQHKKRYDASVAFMETLYPQMLDNFKKYRSIADPIKDSLGREVTNEPNIFVPYPYGIVESELPRLAGKLPRIRIAPRKDVDAQSVELRQDYLYYAFDRMKFLQIQTLWLRQFSIYGWSPLYFFWKKEISKILSLETVGNITKLVKKDFTKYDDFWCKVIDVFDSFLQPGVTAPEDGDWFMFRELVSKDDLKKLVKSGIFYPEVQAFLDEGRKLTAHTDTGRDSRDDIAGFAKDASPHSYGQYELYWCLEDEKITCSLGMEILCMVSDNPNPLQKKPILNVNLTELVSEPIGISTIEGLAGLPDKLNALTNARLKNISLQLGKVFLANRNARVDWDNFVMDSGNLIYTDDINNSVKELEFSDNAISSEREILVTKEEIQFASGTSDYIVGVKSGARLSDTATGVSTIVREANARYNLKAASYESGCLRDLVIACDAYSKLYCTDPKSIYVLGPQGFKSSIITPEDLVWEADIMVEPGSCVPLDQASRSEKLSALLDRVINMPNVVKIDKFMQQVLEANDFRNADELIISQPSSDSIQSDINLAQGENISIGMGQPVPLAGDDQLHMSIHSKIDKASFQPQMLQLLTEHFNAHQSRLEALQQQLIAQQFAGGFNGTQLPNQSGPMPQAGGAGAAPPMGGIPPMAQGAGGFPPQ